MGWCIPHTVRRDHYSYGSSRLGEDHYRRGSYDPYYDPSTKTSDGKVRYELTDHLGNVMATVLDDLIRLDTDNDLLADEFQAALQSAQGYVRSVACYPEGIDPS